jgi:hypothetical protein
MTYYKILYKHKECTNYISKSMMEAKDSALDNNGLCY